MEKIMARFSNFNSVLSQSSNNTDDDDEDEEESKNDQEHKDDDHRSESPEKGAVPQIGL